MLTVMLFNGGLMPTYYIVSKTKLIDTVWALIILEQFLFSTASFS